MDASIRAVTETTVYLDNFQNIDLFFQGYYYFRCRMFYEVEEANLRVHSMPINQFLTSELELRSNNSNSQAQRKNNIMMLPEAAKKNIAAYSMRPPSTLGFASQ